MSRTSTKWFLAMAVTLTLAACNSAAPVPETNTETIDETFSPSPYVNALAATFSSLETAPSPLDSSNQAAWWSPLDEWNGSTYFAFNAPGPADGRHIPTIGKRDSSGNWTFGCVKAADTTCVDYVDDIGHNQPSIAVDGSGRIHAFVSMHNNGWRYFRSSTAENVSTLENRSTELAENGAVTYPTITRAPNGDVYMTARFNTNIGGVGAKKGTLYHWNNSTSTWIKVATYAEAAGYSLYPDDIDVDPNGNVHLAFEWAAYPSSGLRHVGSYLRYNPSTQIWSNAKGTAVTIPVSPSTSSIVYQPLEGTEYFKNNYSADPGEPGIQAAKLALTPNGTSFRPSIAYRYRSTTGGQYGVYRARWTGSAWSKETVYNGGATFAALDTSQTAVSVRVYFSKNLGSGSVEAVVAERNSSTTTWTPTVLASGKKVQRLGVFTRPNGTDVLYLSAPTQLNATTGELYFQTLTR
jgi:hypothetical protein